MEQGMFVIKHYALFWLRQLRICILGFEVAGLVHHTSVWVGPKFILWPQIDATSGTGKFGMAKDYASHSVTDIANLRDALSKPQMKVYALYVVSMLLLRLFARKEGKTDAASPKEQHREHRHISQKRMPWLRDNDDGWPVSITGRQKKSNGPSRMGRFSDKVHVHYSMGKDLYIHQ